MVYIFPQVLIIIIILLVFLIIYKKYFLKENFYVEIDPNRYSSINLSKNTIDTLFYNFKSYKVNDKFNIAGGDKITDIIPLYYKTKKNNKDIKVLDLLPIIWEIYNVYYKKIKDIEHRIDCLNSKIYNIKESRSALMHNPDDMYKLQTEYSDNDNNDNNDDQKYKCIMNFKCNERPCDGVMSIENILRMPTKQYKDFMKI